MKKRILAFLLCMLLLLSLCSSCQKNDPEDSSTLHIAVSTYPLYLFTTALTEGVDTAVVTQLITDQISCLHDYTLTVTAMKSIEQADVLVINGAGLEEFMQDALSETSAYLIDCSNGIALLPSHEEENHAHSDHDAHESEADPHFWLDPLRAAIMLENICAGLSDADPNNRDRYRSNCDAAKEQLYAYAQKWKNILADTELSCRELITFHDGFSYLADAFDFTILKAIEEEAGSEASAAEIREIMDLIVSHNIPAIFTEENGSDTTANAIARETGVTVSSLTMLMYGKERGLAPYLNALDDNMSTLITSLGRKEAYAK